MSKRNHSFTSNDHQWDSLYLLDNYFTVFFLCQLLIDAVTVSSRCPINITFLKECLFIVLGNKGFLLQLVLLHGQQHRMQNKYRDCSHKPYYLHESGVDVLIHVIDAPIAGI